MYDEISAQASSTLYLDGVLRPSTVDIDVFAVSIERRWLINFPNGLPAADRTFVSPTSARCAG